MRIMAAICCAVALSAAAVLHASEPIDARIPFGRLSHLITVEGRIDDSPETFLFVVDTGGLAMLDKAVADRLGLKQRGMMAKIGRLDLGACAIEKVFVVTAFDFGHFASLGRPVHGIIGSNLLERYVVAFDFGEETISLKSDTTAVRPPDGALVLPFRNHPVNNAPLVSMSVGDREIEGMIDTGQPYPLVLPLGELDDFGPDIVSGPVLSRGLMEEWPGTSADHNHLASLGRVEMGGRAFDGVLCLFGELPRPLSMPLVGTAFLSRFTMIVDYHHDIVVLVPRGAAEISPTLFTAGLAVDVNDAGDVVVKGVWEGSPADAAGLDPGDVVVSVDGEPVSSRNSIELIDRLEADAIPSLALTVERGGERRRLTLEKVHLP